MAKQFVRAPNIARFQRVADFSGRNRRAVVVQRRDDFDLEAVTFSRIGQEFRRSGTTTYTYQVCDTSTPTPVCASATVTVTVGANALTVSPDTAATAQNTPVTTNVLGNDSTTGAPLDPASVTVTVPSANGTTTVNPDGTITFTPAAGFSGTTTYTYQVCDTSTPTPVCASATVTVTVGANGVTVTPDTASTAQNTPVTTNVLGNDSTTGAPLDPASVTVTTPSANGTATVNADGTITFTPATGFSGTTTYTYQVCDTSTPTPVCASATVTVTVAAGVLVANPDTVGPVNGGPGNPNAGNVLGNDTLNGQPVTPDTVTVVITDPADPLVPGAPVPVIDPVTGNVAVPPGTPAGSYTIGYQVCEKANPGNCQTTSITVTVGAPALVAGSDAGTVPSTGGAVVPNVLGNDTLNGQPVTIDQVNLTVVGTPPAGISLNPATGAVSVAPGTPAGTYMLTYQVCEKTNPTNCKTATVTITVTASVLVANPDAGSANSSQGGVAVPNVLANDTVNGQPLQLGQVVLRVVSEPSDPGIRLDPATGAVTVAPGTPAGTYQLAYELCERGIPTNCAITRVVVTVSGEVSSMRVTKTAQPRNVKPGDLVRYTVVVENTGVVPVVDASLVDTPPAGFTYVDGSLTVADGDGAGRLVSTHPLGVDQIDVAVGQRATVVYLMRVGAGVRGGSHTNSAVMTDDGRTASNVGTADVQVVADPMTEESTIVGTVWDDRDGDGGQDEGEHGIPGVRVVSVEGVIAETDQFGRYHLAGVVEARDGRGSNFILKVDPATLPQGSRFTTDNPLLRRVTPGVPVRFDFGVQLPVDDRQGGSQEVEMKLGEVFFAPGSADIEPKHRGAIDQMAEGVRKYGAGEVVIVAEGDSDLLSLERAVAVRKALEGALSPAELAKVRIGVRAQAEQPDSMVVGFQAWPLLGTALFDTDSAVIKPRYQALVARMAQVIEQMGATRIVVTGHADPRASQAYNLALGQRRAQAVQQAIAAHLSPELRDRLRVETRDEPAAPAGGK